LHVIRHGHQRYHCWSASGKTVPSQSTAIIHFN
jgi:hypothetical protein